MTENPELALLPTGIGSLPHLEAGKICNVILGNFSEIPFWPQLPKLGFKENMYVQFAYDLPGILIDYERKRINADSEMKLPLEIEGFYKKLTADELTYNREYFPGFHAMLENKKELAEAKAFKGQITGPISLGLQIIDSSSKKSIIYNESYREIIVKALNSKARLQENIMKSLNEHVIIFCDEPSLCMFGTSYLNLSKEEIETSLIEVFKDVKCLKGIHCCGNTDWSLLLDLPIDIISFDAYKYGERLALYAKELKEFLADDRMLAFGIVPSVEEDYRLENLDGLVHKFDGLLKKFVKKGISEKQLLNSSLLTPSCGLAGMGTECAEKALRMTRELSEILRERYGLLGECSQ